jgi:hypothetical protein
MSEAANPICPVVLYTPEGHDHHEAHPMIQLPSGQTQPFTLLKDTPPPNTYTIEFNNTMTAGPNIQNARMYLAAFTTSVSSPNWWSTLSVPIGELQQIQFTTADLNGGTSLWAGAWWDNGTFPDSEQGVKDYFAEHPSGGIHHTVPIILG